MHVTLRFFGTTDDTQLAGLRALVTDLAVRATPTEVRVTSVTGFPTAHRAHVLVLDLADDGALAALAARAELTAGALGFVPESRAYRPHLTLARMRAGADVTALERAADALPRARVTALALYSSTTAATGPVYTPLVRVELPAALRE
jgi:2'-5' RNA ligase